MKNIFIYGIALSVFFLAPTLAHASAQTSNRPSRIFAVSSPVPVRIIRRPVAKKQSIAGELWSTIGPPLLGSTGVIAGTAIAWFTLRKKKKTFTTYYEQISDVQKRYVQNLQSSSMAKSLVKANYTKELTLIQEEAEFTAAQKKLDQEQLAAIVNKVQRMKDEVAT